MKRLILAAIFVAGSTFSTQADTAFVSVTGEGRVEMVPDMAIVSIGVTHQRPTAGAAMDAVAVVAVSDDVQEERVMARGTMTRDQFLAIRAKQMPTEEKRKRADYVIETYDLGDARARVKYVLDDIKDRMRDA